MNNLEKFKKDLYTLTGNGDKLRIGLIKLFFTTEEVENQFEIKPEDDFLNFHNNYEAWYTESLAIISQLVPYRLDDFIKLYKNEKRKDIDAFTYTISDALLGLQVTKSNGVVAGGKSAVTKLDSQVSILQSLKQRFESSLFDIKQIMQADLFDSEIDQCRELNKKGFHRSAGVICGVMLEKHLSLVAENHNIKITKKNPTVADLNQPLKDNSIIDVPMWRSIQHLADIRNLCSHNKDREPTKEEVEDLINGTDKVLKTIF
jgi:hypothetical protein